ncbi:MAG: mechanosensitive ion channel protein MscS [Deltaproteobacteria bacterium]|nr:MAG: mechanosensitive ion channel protein MscS [Deltaproteobacteria bacterium]
MNTENLWQSILTYYSNENVQAVINIFFVVLATAGFYMIGNKIFRRFFVRIANLTKNNWDDILLEHKVFNSLMLGMSCLIPYQCLHLFGKFRPGINKFLNIYFLLVLIITLNRILSAVLDIYDKSAISSRHPLKGYIQLIKMFLNLIGIIFAISILMNKSPWGILSGIGALTAIILLIFKDTVLSFVASIQIASYDLFRKMDWIEMPSFGADGDVIDISLHTVRVQNWDKTIVAIPTHKFLDYSFKNWRGMTLAGGRRIKRHILIDQTSIYICTQKHLARLAEIDFISENIGENIAEAINEKKLNESDSLIINRSFITNSGLFRIYVEKYLRKNPNLRGDLPLMVRQLQSSASQGLPLEIYCFSKVTAWAQYETIQADIIDHILAVMPHFNLRVFQRNSCKDTRGDFKLIT